MLWKNLLFALSKTRRKIDADCCKLPGSFKTSKMPFAVTKSFLAKVTHSPALYWSPGEDVILCTNGGGIILVCNCSYFNLIVRNYSDL